MEQRPKSLAEQKMEFRLHDELIAMLRQWGATTSHDVTDVAVLVLSDDQTAAMLMELFDKEEDGDRTEDLLRLAFARLADLIYTSQKLRDTLAVANKTAKRRRAMYLAAKDRAGAMADHYERQDESEGPLCGGTGMAEQIRAVFDPPQED